MKKAIWALFILLVGLIYCGLITGAVLLINEGIDKLIGVVG